MGPPGCFDGLASNRYFEAIIKVVTKTISQGSQPSGHYRRALEQTKYENAKALLLEFERWLSGINESAADSLLEAIEEILSLHRLNYIGLKFFRIFCKKIL